MINIVQNVVFNYKKCPFNDQKIMNDTFKNSLRNFEGF